MAELLRLETSTEKAYVKYVESYDCTALKINKRSWPDRFTVLRYGYGFYIEFKRDNKRFGKRQGEKYQQHTHNELRKRGIHVYLVDDLQQAKEIFHYELFELNNRHNKIFQELKI